MVDLHKHKWLVMSDGTPVVSSDGRYSDPGWTYQPILDTLVEGVQSLADEVHGAWRVRSAAHIVPCSALHTWALGDRR